MSRSVELRPHPTSPNADVASIRADVERTSDGFLRVRFQLRGACARLAIPKPAPPRMVSGLWRHTCFEAFVALAGEAPYHEYNVSPSGEWAVHAFRGYRDGGVIEDETFRPTTRAVVRDDALDLDIGFALARLSRHHVRRALDVGLSVVLEASDAGLSYWAIRHPAERPDFHLRETLALHLEAPDSE